MKAKRSHEHPFVKYLYILPLMLLLIGMFAYPVLQTLYLSFFKVTIGSPKEVFVGLQNYRDLLADPIFKKTFVNSIVWTMGNLILQSVFAQLIANILNAKFRGRNLVRTSVLLPWIVPSVAIALVIRWICLPGVGIVNKILLDLGVITKAVEFLGYKNAMATLIVLGTWKYVPIGVLLILSALQTIPGELYEAAQVDGASKWQQYARITFPIIGRMLGFTTFTIFVLNFNSFDLIWMVLQGGPGDATQTLPVLVYRYAFKMLSLGSASAVSIVIALILAVVGIIYLWTSSRGSKNNEV